MSASVATDTNKARPWRYRNLGDEIRIAAREYAEEVRHGHFPDAEHTYAAPRRAKPAAAK